MLGLGERADATAAAEQAEADGEPARAPLREHRRAPARPPAAEAAEAPAEHPTEALGLMAALTRHPAALAQRRRTSKQLDTLRSLGLRRIGHTVEVKDCEQARGMLHAVRHLRRGQGGQREPRRRASRSERIGLHSLAPAPGSRRPRKRVGRGEGSGTGKTSGRGQKGAGSRSGSKRRARFEGGQMPIHMRMRKLRGPHMKKSMPFEPFRTHTQPVNIAALESRFDAGAEVTIELMKSKGLATRKDIPVKVLAKGELSKALTVHAHAFSAGARERIEAAGGTCNARRALATGQPCTRQAHERID